MFSVVSIRIGEGRRDRTVTPHNEQEKGRREGDGIIPHCTAKGATIHDADFG